nr:ABC transporter ATP-binding protein [Clostridium sp.]
KYNQTLILITHDVNIAAMADRVITIEDGEIISDKNLKAVK